MISTKGQIDGSGRHFDIFGGRKILRESQGASREKILAGKSLTSTISKGNMIVGRL